MARARYPCKFCSTRGRQRPPSPPPQRPPAGRRGSKERRRRCSGRPIRPRSSAPRTASHRRSSTCASRRSYRSRSSWVGSGCRVIASPGESSDSASAVASFAKHSIGVPGLLVSGLSRPMILTFSSTPLTSAWIVSPSTTRITVAGTPPGMTRLGATEAGEGRGGVVAATSRTGREVGSVD